MHIDTPLIRLRYEILNISIEELAQDESLPASVLEAEALAKGWRQWWPNEVEVESDVNHDRGYDPLLDDTEDESELEQGSQKYLKDMGLRMQVYTMAKDAYLSHKRASLESAILDRAAEVTTGMTLMPQDLKHLAGVFKDLASSIAAGKSLSIGTNDDGLPTVIIRDLRGRQPQ